MKPAHRLRALAAAAVAVPLLAGCGDAAGSASGKPTVVASFYPLEYVAQRVVGEHATVDNLTSPGTEPHDLELSVQQTVSIADADIAFYQEGFQPAVDEAIEQNAPDHVVDAHGGATDPHFWLDPLELGAAAAGFTDEMVEADPDHADQYRANLAELQEDLTELDRDFRRGLSGCATETVVVSHDAFGYLEKYGLRFRAIAGLSPDAEPSPAHIQELHELIESEQISTVFTETLASPAMAETIARDLGLRTAVLDPVEGLSDATADEDYLSLMRENLAALQKANGCR